MQFKLCGNNHVVLCRYRRKSAGIHDTCFCQHFLYTISQRNTSIHTYHTPQSDACLFRAFSWFSRLIRFAWFHKDHTKKKFSPKLRRNLLPMYIHTVHTSYMQSTNNSAIRSNTPTIAISKTILTKIILKLRLYNVSWLPPSQGGV